MARMLQFLQKNYPNTTNKFINDFICNKYINVADFEEMDLGSRYLLVKSFFGYERHYDINLSVEQIQKHIIYLFEDYEQLMIRYPLGFPDPLKILGNMSNKDKTDFISKFKPELLVCLNHAICPRTYFNDVSLKDAIKPRNIPVIEQMSLNRAGSMREENDFWEGIKKIYKKELVAPF